MQFDFLLRRIICLNKDMNWLYLIIMYLASGQQEIFLIIYLPKIKTWRFNSFCSSCLFDNDPNFRQFEFYSSSYSYLWQSTSLSLYIYIYITSQSRTTTLMYNMANSALLYTFSLNVKLSLTSENAFSMWIISKNYLKCCPFWEKQNHTKKYKTKPDHCHIKNPATRLLAMLIYR